MVPSPGLDVHLDAFEVTGGDRGSPRWLSTSPEYQMKRLLAQGLSRIYQIAPCFRRGESGARHNPEFTMVEWYRSAAGIAEVMADTEQLVAAVTGGVVRVGRPELRRGAAVRANPGLRGVRAVRGLVPGGDAGGRRVRRGPLLSCARRSGGAGSGRVAEGPLPRRLPRDPGLARTAQAGRSAPGRALRALRGRGRAVQRLRRARRSRRAAGAPRAGPGDRGAPGACRSIRSTSGSSPPSSGCRRAGATRSASTGSSRSLAGRPRSPTSSPSRLTRSDRRSHRIGGRPAHVRAHATHGELDGVRQGRDDRASRRLDAPGSAARRARTRRTGCRRRRWPAPGARRDRPRTPRGACCRYASPKPSMRRSTSPSIASQVLSNGPNPAPPTTIIASASLAVATLETSCRMYSGSPLTITLRMSEKAARTSSVTALARSSSVRLLYVVTVATRTRGVGRSGSLI